MEEQECDFKPVTVRQLKEFLKDWPEIDDNGDPYEVWIGYVDGLSTTAGSICKLNQFDILLDIW